MDISNIPFLELNTQINYLDKIRKFLPSTNILNVSTKNLSVNNDITQTYSDILKQNIQKSYNKNNLTVSSIEHKQNKSKFPIKNKNHNTKEMKFNSYTNKPPVKIRSCEEKSKQENGIISAAELYKPLNTENKITELNYICNRSLVKSLESPKKLINKQSDNYLKLNVVLKENESIIKENKSLKKEMKELKNQLSQCNSTIRNLRQSMEMKNQSIDSFKEKYLNARKHLKYSKDNFLYQIKLKDEKIEKYELMLEIKNVTDNNSLKKKKLCISKTKNKFDNKELIINSVENILLNKTTDIFGKNISNDSCEYIKFENIDSIKNKSLLDPNSKLDSIKKSIPNSVQYLENISGNTSIFENSLNTNYTLKENICKADQHNTLKDIKKVESEEVISLGDIQIETFDCNDGTISNKDF